MQKPHCRSAVLAMVRVERIELSSRAWKACILATVLHPHYTNYNRLCATIECMRINKFIGTNSDEKPFHSSGYAQVSQGERIGSVSAETFSQRQATQKNRQLIGHYKDARISQNRSYDHSSRTSSYRTPSSRRVEHTADARQELSNDSMQNRQPSASASNRTVFNEPKSRKYDPYR